MKYERARDRIARTNKYLIIKWYVNKQTCKNTNYQSNEVIQAGKNAILSQDKSLFIKSKFCVSDDIRGDMRMMWIPSTNLLSFNTHAKPVAPIAKFLLTLEKLNLSVSRKNLICQPPVDKFVKSQRYSRQRNKCQQETNTVSTQSLWFTFGSCRNISIKIECPCCNEVDVVAGITNEIKMSY